LQTIFNQAGWTRLSVPLVTSGPGVILSAFVPAILVLADGTVSVVMGLVPKVIGVGEVVFNTSMTGYQEILTDPSYCRQIVTLTYPHIGNVGTNREDEESSGIHASG
jgi:carbamoyl-phosphate synthase small subunit